MNNSHSTVRGLVLRDRDLKESDKILTVLTDSMGKQTFLAKGARRKGSRIRSAAQLLTYNEFTVFEYKNWIHVNEAETLEAFIGLRDDLDRLSLATYFCELLEAVTDADWADPAVLQLALNGIFALSEASWDIRVVKAGFELRLMCLAGYEPMLEGCSVCGCDTPDRFNIRRGIVHCSACAEKAGDGISMPMDKATYAAMRHIVTCQPRRIFSFRLDAASLEEMTHITESYVLSQLERGFDTLDFYKSLQIEGLQKD